MPNLETILLSKGSFIIDLAQLAFGSTIGRIVVGVIVAAVVIIYVVGKILNAQEARQNAANPDFNRSEADRARST